MNATCFKSAGIKTEKPLGEKEETPVYGVKEFIFYFY